jgi:hypothetical protein
MTFNTFLLEWLRKVPFHGLLFCPQFKMMNPGFICCNILGYEICPSSSNYINNSEEMDFLMVFV